MVIGEQCISLCLPILYFSIGFCYTAHGDCVSFRVQERCHGYVGEGSASRSFLVPRFSLRRWMGLVRLGLGLGYVVADFSTHSGLCSSYDCDVEAGGCRSSGFILVVDGVGCEFVAVSCRNSMIVNQIVHVGMCIVAYG